ncbi:hypothetical protein FIV42_12915 [Persicimonas caeni]|uniref:Transposase IS200-like domain-containing protein n=1 Tax=Persicimonas caeni TaxID=2292766 RepID=A0A4Y6PTF8_PERCE|nr:transposase [Persicimonas caeni]QDG51616.1 hypothetical protein FIV42_12915 [Persicimonas caeni]QED32837.1 hypothetical protein FRD00_12910 [Persicimonas caeni]
MKNYFDYSGPQRFRRGESLPHLEVDGGIYFVTICLQDSIPKKQLARFKAEREEELERLKKQKKLTSKTRQLVDDGYFEKVDGVLDQGHGSMLLQRDDVAQIVADAFEYFHRDRYDLDMWSIMGSHAHLTLQTRRGHWLSDIMHSWKSFTGNEINKLVGREGKLWQADFYDRLLRSEEELAEKRKYVWRNPEAAGFKEWKWRRQYPDRWSKDEEKAS